MAVTICFPGKEGIQVFCNRTWPRLTGYSEEELLGTSFFDLLHPDDDSIDWAFVPISFDTAETRVVPIWVLQVPLGTSNGFHLTVVDRGGQAHEEIIIRVHLAIQIHTGKIANGDIQLLQRQH